MTFIFQYKFTDKTGSFLIDQGPGSCVSSAAFNPYMVVSP